jgi:hypothetical protein
MLVFNFELIIYLVFIGLLSKPLLELSLFVLSNFLGIFELTFIIYFFKLSDFFFVVVRLHLVHGALPVVGLSFFNLFQCLHLGKFNLIIHSFLYSLLRLKTWSRSVLSFFFISLCAAIGSHFKMINFNCDKKTLKLN